MNFVKSSLNKLDLFAPHFEFQLHPNSTRFSTTLGGLYSLMLAVLGISLTLVKLVIWYQQKVTPSVAASFIS
jgi:hypothetical protein